MIQRNIRYYYVMDNEEVILKNLYQVVNKYNINKNDAEELTSIILSLIEDLIISDPMILITPDYQEHIIDNITNLINIQFEDVYGNPFDHYTHTRLNKLIKESLEIYYLLFTPKRSYGNSFIRKKPNIRKMENKILYLSGIPQPNQLTDEWYIFRHKYLTASSIWKVFSTQGSRNQLIYNKCKPLDTKKYKGFSTDSPMHWGHKYEPLSIYWYEHNYHTKVSDFGCIPHRHIEFIAASPDGINTCNNSERYGRMLEVKNIVNRVITGIPKMEYWIQMQVQMEVCELNECDFLETRFKEYATEEEFYKDGDTFQKTKDNKHKGIILYFVKDGQAFYEYAPFMCSKEEFIKWETKKMVENENITWIQNIYWNLEEISCVLILRNKTWFSGALPMLKEFWSIIQQEKHSDYEHRAPKKRDKTKISPNLKPSKCIINIDTLSLEGNVIKNETQSTKNIIHKSKQTNENILEPKKECIIKINTAGLAD